MSPEARDQPRLPEIYSPGISVETPEDGCGGPPCSAWWKPDSTELLRRLDGMPLLRQLALERGFRWMCLLLAGGVAILAMASAPVWVVTPPGFVPVLRISGLDYLESMEHGRRCEQAWERGAMDEALAEWKTALARHPTRIRLIRRGLDRVASLSAVERRDPRYQSVVMNALWLLRLTGTNRVDADLVVRALDGPCAERGLAGLFGQLPGRRTPVQRAVTILAGIRARGFGVFEPTWPTATGLRDLDQDLMLCRVGWLAARGEPRLAQRAWAQLEQTSNSPGGGLWSMQLQLWALAARGDLLGYESVLARLQRLRGDLPVHSVGHWKLLVEHGRREEARTLALGYRGMPVSGQEVCLLAEAFFELGLEEWAFQFLGRQAVLGNSGLEVWLLCSGELARRGRWEQLGEVGTHLRGLGGIGAWQQGLGLYLEGLSRHGRGEWALAQHCFEKASRCALRPAPLGFELGRRVLSLGYAECSLHWLEHYEREFARDPDYWRCRARAADMARDWDALVIASKRRLEIDAGDLMAWNDLVMAELTREELPVEVLGQSAFALELDPGSSIARLNRVLVLLRAGRYAEARAGLSLLGEGEGEGEGGLPRLGNRIRAARFELHARLEQPEQAFAEWAHLDLDGLEPSWRERLKKLRRRLEVRVSRRTDPSISSGRESN